MSDKTMASGNEPKKRDPDLGGGGNRHETGGGESPAAGKTGRRWRCRVEGWPRRRGAAE